MKSTVTLLLIVLIGLVSILAVAEEAPALPPLDLAALAQPGDALEYGPYTVTVLAGGVYHLQDGVKAYPPGIWEKPDANGTAMNNTSEMYIVNGDQKALLIDLSNRITRDQAAEALKNIVLGLKGERELEIVITHSHGDHTGMGGVFLADEAVKFWFPHDEYASFLRQNADITVDRLSLFQPGDKVFDLGGRIVDTVRAQGHTVNPAILSIVGENIMFSGDSIGSGRGVWIWGMQGLANYLEGVDNLVNYINANFTEEAREALVIYGGHGWQYGKWTDSGKPYLDWQYVQDMQKAIHGARDGAWFDPDSGVKVEKWETPINTLNCDVVYGSAGISCAYSALCDYAGYTESGVKRSDYVWGEFLGENDIPAMGGGTVVNGAYLDLFEDKVYTDATIGDLAYYFYDPIAHGADPDKTYPVLFWLHGSGNALDGKMSVAYSGAEPFASPEYQEAMGGAYIICPLANETRGDQGQTLGNWMTRTEDGSTSYYSAALKGILDTELAANAEHVGKVIGSGTSAGGYGIWRFIIDYTDAVDACLVMAGAYLPTPEELDKIEASGMKLWVTHGYYDELVGYDRFIEPIISRLLIMDNTDVSIFKWVRNGDYTIATLNFGIEMGQHCICVQIGQNLIYNDGTPYDKHFPRGVTGWIYDIVNNP